MLQTFSGRKASQNEFELRSFIALLQEKGVTSYAEIGARHGDTFHEIMLSLPPGSMGIAVDYPGALWGTHKSQESLKRVINDLNARGYQCKAIFGDSTDQEVIDMLYYDDKHGRGFSNQWDAMLIDGDHTYAGVSKDWKNYQSAAPIIAFHDIVGEGQAERVYNNPVEVPRLWSEIKTGNESLPFYTIHEFIDEGSKMGIGVVCA
jgi:hypothetical protein